MMLGTSVDKRPFACVIGPRVPSARTTGPLPTKLALFGFHSFRDSFYHFHGLLSLPRPPVTATIFYQPAPLPPAILPHCFPAPPSHDPLTSLTITTAPRPSIHTFLVAWFTPASPPPNLQPPKPFQPPITQARRASSDVDPSAPHSLGPSRCRAP